jgi:predicted metalloprotease with PDZ domain
MRIRPAEYRSIDYRTQPPTSGLWFSEGMSMFYADLLARRAGLRTFDSTRVGHLERLLSSYLANPGNARFSAEAVSRVAYNASPGSLGDYDASTHLQGELLGTMLDLLVRDGTGGRRSLDDVMRAMLEGFSGERGFLGADIERTVARVCGCPVQSFFAGYVRGAGLLDFNRYLALAGLRATVTRTKALNQDGQPAPDFRIRSWLPPGEEHLRLWLFNPESDWSRAGLHTGDQLLRFNGASPATSVDFRSMLVRLRIGDTVRVEVQRPSGRANATIIVGGYDRPVVRIEQLPHASRRQQRIREAWMASAP